MTAPLPGVVRDLDTSAAELRLGLFLGEELVASVTASPAALAELHAELAMTRDDVRATMLSALQARRNDGMPSLLMTAPRATPSRLASIYFHSTGDRTVAGCVWFDVATSSTGPTDLPRAVRSHMRSVVDRLFVPRGASPQLVDALLKWDDAVRLEEAPELLPPSSKQ